MCKLSTKTKKSALEGLVSGSIFPHSQLDWICNAWAVAVHSGTKDSWQYVEGCMAGCGMFYRGTNKINDELQFLRDVAAMRRILCEA